MGIDRETTMRNTDKSRNYKLVSPVAMFLSAAVILGGMGVRTRAADETFIGARDAVVTSGVGRSVYEEQIPMTVGLAGENTARSFGRSVDVYINGAKYGGSAFLYKDTTYVGLREFSVAVAGATVSWNSKTVTATAKTASTTVNATKGKEYISANGRYFWAKTGVLIDNGTMYVPVRPLCLAFGASVKWDGSSYTVSVTKGSGTVQTGSSYYDSDEVYWLSKIIHAESRGESMTGKIAVGNVVLNRVRSKDYPDTIYGVIFDRKHGVQFSPVADGTINLEPDAESVIAAKLCLEGYTVSSSILFFINKNIATNMWVTNNKTLTVSIGKHDFYA